MIFSQTDDPTYVTSDHSLIMHLLVCGVKPARTERDGRRVTVHFPEQPALSVITETAKNAEYRVLLTDVLRANIVWKGILDGTT